MPPRLARIEPERKNRQTHTHTTTLPGNPLKSIKGPYLTRKRHKKSFNLFLGRR